MASTSPPGSHIPLRGLALARHTFAVVGHDPSGAVAKASQQLNSKGSKRSETTVNKPRNSDKIVEGSMMREVRQEGIRERKGVKFGTRDSYGR